MLLTAHRFRITAALVAMLVAAAVALLAWQTWTSHQTERALLEQQAEHRARQLAASVAGRISAIVRSVDFVLLEVRREYGVNETAFQALAERVRASFPEEPALLLQFTVAATDGKLVYSSLGHVDAVSIADRDAFKVHLDGRDRLHVSEPVLGRVSGVWSIHFTRPVLREGRFAGTAAIALSPRQLGALLHSFDALSDAQLALLGPHGTVLALSQREQLAGQLGRKLPGVEPGAFDSASLQGVARDEIFGDGVERLVAWHRVAGTKLVAVAALDRAATLAPLTRHFRRALNHTAAFAAALVILGGGIIALLLRMARQQQAVAASEARFRSLTKLSSDWYWEQDEKFRFTLVAGDKVARTGISAGAHLGRTRWDIPALNLNESDWARHRALLEAHEPFRDFEIRRPDTAAGPHWVSVSGEPLFDEHGRFAGYRGVGRDITDRKLTEQALRDLTERLRIGQATARLIVMDWDVGADRITWSDREDWLRGPLPADGRYPFWKDQVHAEDRGRFLAIRAQSLDTLRGQTLEYRIVRTDGEVLWLRSHQKVFAGPDGKAQRVIVAMLDITAQKLTEGRLRQSEARLAEAQRIVQIGSWELDIASNLLTWSDEAYRIFEIDRAEFGASYEAFLDLVHPEDRAAVDRAYSRSLETRAPYQIVHRLRMPDGRIKHVEERCETQFAADGAALRSRGTVQDVTVRLLAERALRESQAALAGVIDTAMDAIITIDEHRRILSFNPAAERIFGYRAAEVLERPVDILLPERLRGRHHDLIERFGESGEIRRSMGTPGEVAGLRQDGSEILLEATIARVETLDRLRFSVMLRDVTERRRSEERERAQAARLRKLSHRLREVEERERRAMARELHDRIGQSLSALDLSLGMLGRQIASGRLEAASGQLADMQQTLKATIGHARDLMCELRPPALEEYGLLAALKDLAADFRRRTKIAAGIAGDPAQPRPPEAVEISMYRIAQEALNNVAKHAGATGVRLNLCSTAEALELAISDDGVGFDPGRPGNGNPTWGLATMRERAEESGIELTIDSKPGGGTRVTLRAPRQA
jgi:PAS domain S-box-containing protein